MTSFLIANRKKKKRAVPAPGSQVLLSPSQSEEDEAKNEGRTRGTIKEISIFPPSRN